MKPYTRLGIVLAISIAFFSVEITIGSRIKSLVCFGSSHSLLIPELSLKALIADAFHYLNVSLVNLYIEGLLLVILGHCCICNCLLCIICTRKWVQTFWLHICTPSSRTCWLIFQWCISSCTCALYFITVCGTVYQ